MKSGSIIRTDSLPLSRTVSVVTLKTSQSHNPKISPEVTRHKSHL